MKKTGIVILILLICAMVVFFLARQKKPTIAVSPYPDGKNFAFSITDDPDFSKRWKIRQVYWFLDSIGIKTTMAVWVKKPERSNGVPDVAGDYFYGQTCENPKYLAFIKSMQQRGFEIALHTVSGGNDPRESTIEGYETFKTMFGHYPKINIMHAENLENIYWGGNVIENRLLRYLAAFLYPKTKLPFGGEDPDSPYYWGDVLKAKTKYVRLWGTEDINTLKFDPRMPYHNPKTPYVNYWFSFSDGYSPAIFSKMLSSENIQRLEKERGTCIAYTHFASGFARKDKTGKRVVDPEFKQRMTELSKHKEGWFVPVSTILDRLLAVKNLRLTANGSTLSVENQNRFDMDGVTLLMAPGAEFSIGNEVLRADDQGEIIIGTLKAGEVRNFEFLDGRLRVYELSEKRGVLEKYRILYERTKLIFKHRFSNREAS
jgi:hypothetical protein